MTIDSLNILMKLNFIIRFHIEHELNCVKTNHRHLNRDEHNSITDFINQQYLSVYCSLIELSDLELS